MNDEVVVNVEMDVAVLIPVRMGVEILPRVELDVTFNCDRLE